MRRTPTDLPPRGLGTRSPTLPEVSLRHPSGPPVVPQRTHTQPFIAHASAPTFGQSANYRRLEDLDYEIAPKSSILLPHLQANEKKFFELVHSGNLAFVVSPWPFAFRINTYIIQFHLLHFWVVLILFNSYSIGFFRSSFDLSYKLFNEHRVKMVFLQLEFFSQLLLWKIIACEGICSFADHSDSLIAI